MDEDLPDATEEARVRDQGGGPVDLGRLNRNLGFRLRRVNQRLSRKFGERTRPFGFRSGGISALAIIEANPGISQIEIAREVDVDASVAVGMINDMRQRALISRTRLPNDKRRYAIAITDKGRGLLDEIFAMIEEMENQSLRCLSPTELLFLGRILDKLYSQMDDDRPDASGASGAD
jgi:DNA-binding MarR family transcriptional regulator